MNSLENYINNFEPRNDPVFLWFEMFPNTAIPNQNYVEEKFENVI